MENEIRKTAWLAEVTKDGFGDVGKGEGALRRTVPSCRAFSKIYTHTALAIGIRSLG
jgi:hypothetical protein